MRKATLKLIKAFFLIIAVNPVFAADVVPTEIEMPGTQPNEVGSFESPDKCDNCHAGYNNAEPDAEPATGWRGAAMGNAGRDPIFWATLGVAEQDFDGAGDLCIRCHSAGGWYGGRSTPTDGSGLRASDDNGIDCDTCHTMTNPDNSDPILQGVMNSPFTANCSDDDIANNSCDTASDGYYGSGMLSLWGGSDKLGPYDDAEARHQFQKSAFHRDVDFCGSCHDVSNSAVGDLAPGNGAQPGAPHVISSQDFNGGAPNLGGPVEEKAAFNNPPFAYGIVERTFSEYKASAFPTTRVADFSNLPTDLQTAGGSLDVTYQAALAAGNGGDYADGDPRYFSCQSCHMRPTTSAGCNKNGAPVRSDMPKHDHTGGNYWLADVIKYQDSQGHLRLGGDLNTTQLIALDYGQQRAKDHLSQAGALEVSGNALKVINLTGHKLITGYPEGRRMWLNIKWHDASGNLLREDGAYGPLVDGNGNPVTIANPAGGPDIQVESILDLNAPNTRIYEAHYAMNKEWADTLLAVGKPADLPLSFNRETGAVEMTLGELAALPAGSFHDTFHFALNNYVSKDNRIPPYGMRYDTAKKRNALPMPETQYGNPGAGGIYDYWDTVNLNVPANAASADIQLLYQGTSWEYIQFLFLANTGQNAFLGEEGVNMLEAWLNATNPDGKTMVPPVVMATATWGTPPTGNNPPVAADDSYSIHQDVSLTIAAPGVLGNDSDADNDSITAAQVSGTSNGTLALNSNGSFDYTPAPGFSGSDSFTYQASDDKGALSNIATVLITVAPTGGGNTAGVSAIETGFYSGKGNNRTFSTSSAFTRGDTVVIRSTVTDGGNPLEGAVVTTTISEPENTTVTSEPSNASGIAEASWKTSAPKRNGNGGTTTGSYTATTSDVSADGYTWDGVGNSAGFELN